MNRRKARAIARDGRPLLIQALSLLLLLTAAILLSGCSTWNDMWGDNSGSQTSQIGEGANTAPGTAGDTESWSQSNRSGTTSGTTSRSGTSSNTGNWSQSHRSGSSSGYGSGY